jgi:ribosomal protein L37AE/L43A
MEVKMSKFIDGAATLDEIKQWVSLQEEIEREEGKQYYCWDCVARLRKRLEDKYVCPICGQIFFRRIIFDADGATQDCPIFFLGGTYELCKRCLYYRGSEGFDVFCAYPK